MILNFCYYAIYLCWYGVKYKNELKFIRYIINNHLLLPRIKYDIRSAYRRVALQSINIIDNYF